LLKLFEAKPPIKKKLERMPGKWECTIMYMATVKNTPK